MSSTNALSNHTNLTNQPPINPTTARNATESPLLRLPAELRLQIWAYVVGDRIYRLSTKYYSQDDSRLPHFTLEPPLPTLPATCRQLNAETASLFKPNNPGTFYVATQTQWAIWLHCFERMPQTVRKLRLGFGMYWVLPPKGDDSGLARAVPGLKELEVSFYRVDFDEGSRGEEYEYENEWAKEWMCEWLMKGYEEGEAMVV